MSNGDLWVYGHSFTQDPGVQCTLGQEFYKLVKTAADFATVTTYGVGSSRAVDIAQDVVNQAARTPKAGSAWDGTRTGAIILDCLENDVINNAEGGSHDPTDLTATMQANLQETIQVILAVLMSAGRVETSTGTKGGTWVADPTATRYSGGSVQRSSVNGSTLTINVTVPAAGYVWLLHYGTNNAQGGAFTITEGATTLASRTQAEMQVVNIWSKRTTAAVETVFPFVTKVTASPGAHTFVVTKTGNDAGNLFLDAFLLPSSNPLPIAFLRDPLVQPNTTGNVAGNATNYPIVAANLPKVNAAASAAIALINHPRLVDVDPQITAAMQSPDFLHPNDAGMAQMASAIVGSSWLAVGESPDHGGLPRQGGSLILTTGSGTVDSRGFLRDASGDLVVTTSTVGATWQQGFLRGPASAGHGVGPLVIVDGGSGTFLNGFLRGTSGELVTTTVATGATNVSGLLRSPAGLLVVIQNTA